jgi:hypothetical protein
VLLVHLLLQTLDAERPESMTPPEKVHWLAEMVIDVAYCLESCPAARGGVERQRHPCLDWVSAGVHSMQPVSQA